MACFRIILSFLEKFKYAEERNTLIKELLKSKSSFTLNSIAYTSFMQLQGARYPAVTPNVTNDTLEYPEGTALEFLRQGLLTYNTYVSALQLSPSLTPSMASFQPTSTSSQGRRFYQGQVGFFVCLFFHSFIHSFIHSMISR